jgi:integrase/recombinase XerD
VAIDNALASFLNHLSVERGASKHTIAAYRRDLSSLEAFLESGGAQIASASPASIRDYIANLRSHGMSEASIARRVVAIRSFFRFCSKEYGVSDISPDIDVPRIPKRLPKALSISEVNSLIDGAGSEGVQLRDRALIELLYSSGARVSEVVSLNLHDVSSTTEGVATIMVRGKGGKDRIVPVGSFARRAMDDYLVRIRPRLNEKKGSEALFLNNGGGRLSRQAAWSIVMRAAERTGLEKKVSPHALRHSFATHLLDGGADIRVVQELLGHSSVTTTQVYTLVTIDKLRESYASAHPRSR